MSYLVDNDIAMKLAQTDLLQEACSMFGLTAANTLRLAGLRFVGPRKIEKKKLADRIGARISQRIVRFCDQYPPIEEPGDPKILEQLASPKIDAGEALLLTRAVLDPAAVLLTGDKRCIIALATDPKLMPVAKRLLARIELVETVFLRLIDRLGFDAVQKRVLSAAPVDGMLDLAFLTQEADPEAHARAALISAEAQIAELMPGLVRGR